MASNKELKAAQHSENLRTFREISVVALSNPVFTGLAALAINQALYKTGLYDPRNTLPGESTERVASQNATTIAQCIIAGTAAWAATKAASSMDLSGIVSLAGLIK